MFKSILKITTILTLLASYSLADTGRDPFMPFFFNKPAPDAQKDTLSDIASPLKDKPLSSFRLVGLIVSPTDAIAVVKGRDRHEYFVTVGDTLGSEAGMVEIIDSEGITLDVGGRLITLNVNNSFEIKNESE